MAIRGEPLAQLAAQLFPDPTPEGDELAALGHYFDPLDAAADQILWKEGDPGDSAVFILEGEVQLMKETEFGGRRIILALLGPGSLAGEPCLANGGPRITTAQATQPTQLITLNRENLHKLVGEHPVLGVRVLQVLLGASARRLAQAYQRLSSIF